MSKEITIEKDSVLEVLKENPKLSPMKSVYAGVGLIVTKLSSFVIKNSDNYDLAMLALKEGKDAISEMDKAWENSVGAEDRTVKKATDVYKLITAPIELGLKDLKKKMAKFQEDQEQRRQDEINALELKKKQEEEKLASAETSKEQSKIEAKVEKLEAKQEAIADYKPKTADKTRKFEVIDPDKVDRKYCTPEDKKIRPFIGEVNGPIPEIAGVRIWDEIKIVTR